MARPKCIGVRETLTTLLPKAEIERLAHESGAVRRRRKVDASAMLWSVLLGFGTGRERTLEGVPRTYERVTGKSLVPSSFYDRFTKELARMFRAVLKELMSKLASSEVRYGGVLEGFRDVLVADATVVKLHRLLARRFPGTRKNSSPAAAKLHLVMSVSGGGAHKVKVTGERANDHRTVQMGPWVEGRLLLFDLGYFRYQLFDCIDRNGGYFITRLATNADPRIVATLELIRFRGHPDTVQRRCSQWQRHMGLTRRSTVSRWSSWSERAARQGSCPGSSGAQHQTIRNWVGQCERDEGRRKDGLNTDEREELRRLRRENRRLREEREILKKAAVWFAQETGTMSGRSSSS